TFSILFIGQVFSLLGTSLTRFGVSVWAFEQIGTATSLALLGFFSCITFVIASPFAGVLVDRMDRRKVMLFSDLGSGIATITMLALFLTGHLAIWHIYVAEGIAGMLEAFQYPAWLSSTSLLVPKEQYTRINGLVGLGRSASRLLAPSIASVLQTTLGLGCVMGVDLVSMTVAVGTLLFVRIPAPPLSQEGETARGSFFQEMRFGFGYIFRNQGLTALLINFFMVNLFATLTYFAVYTPMILARTGGDAVVLGIVRTVMGIGGVAGGLIITLWGGPKRKISGYLISTGISFLVCDFLTAISRSAVSWSISGFLSDLTIPFIVAPYYALWQVLIPPDVQGKVFSAREMVQVSSQPVGYLLGGFLADRLFEPAMQPGGVLLGIFGGLVGSGPGSGMSAMFLFTSFFGAVIGFSGLLLPSLRKLAKQIGE
ncbi:MAG TPA: MFS transporter, partial [Longilinea sp.]|nr:MFS transporter [Longilinea sp.]